MKKVLCFLTGIFLITGCSAKTTKTKLMSDLEAMNFCEGIACEKGLILKENMNRMLLICFEKVLEPLPNEITSSQLRQIKPEIQKCVQSQGEFTPIISKEKMLFLVKDRDNYNKFSKFKPNISRLELNNLVADCYRVVLEKLPPVISMNQFKIVELNVEKCIFEKFNSSN